MPTIDPKIGFITCALGVPKIKMILQGPLIMVEPGIGLVETTGQELSIFTKTFLAVLSYRFLPHSSTKLDTRRKVITVAKVAHAKHPVTRISDITEPTPINSYTVGGMVYPVKIQQNLPGKWVSITPEEFKTEPLISAPDLIFRRLLRRKPNCTDFFTLPRIP